VVDIYVPRLLILSLLGGDFIKEQNVMVDSKDVETNGEADIAPQWLVNNETIQNPKEN
jgi:hypothetical protein